MRMIALAALLLATACYPRTTTTRALQGVDWAAADVNGVPVQGGPLTMRLADGRASGHSGCNSWSAPYDLRSNEGIRFGAIEVTEMACAPELMEQERRFLSVIRLAQGYTHYGSGGFSLIAGDGRAIRFRPR